MQPTAGFWEFVRMCFDAAWDATLAYLKLEPRAVGIAVVALIAGFLLFWWRRGVKKAQEKAVEDFLWITAPFAGIALILLVVNIVRSPHLVYRADQEGARQVINQ